MPDIYIQNATAQYREVVGSISDLETRNTILIPPFAQAKVTIADQPSHDAFAAKLDSYAMPHAPAPTPLPVVQASAPKHVAPPKKK